MLSLYDAATREVEAIRTGHRRELRVLAVAPVATDPGDPDLAQLRTWLLPDQLRRAGERRSLVPTVCEVTAPGPPGGEPLPAAVRAALNIHPPARIAPDTEPVEATVQFAGGGAPAFDIGTGDTGWLAGLDVVRYHAAPTGNVTAGPDGHGPRRLSELTARGIDPLAARLGFMRQRYRDGVDLSWDQLASQDKTLTGWRIAVAQWANSPSAAMSTGYTEAISAAFEDDLDTPAALAQLQLLHDDTGVAPGAKFETFAAADRLLGLDLARDIGRY
ncbi:MAG TPA: hypothetical protein VG268_10815 [Streptosporangiaceae bacterium]|nr:hypothetical protein [Streptosporangiaceae bacterium]